MQEGFTIQLREPQQEQQLVPLATLAYAIAQESLEVNRHAASIGRLLIQAKEQLPDDKGFMEWVQENCRFSHSTALNLMKFARGVEETPALQGHSQSFVLEVLKLPAAEREQFAQEHEGDSVRKIRELIAERDKARQDADRAEKARLRIEEGFQEAAKKLDEVAGQRDFFKQQYEAVSDQPPETIEVEVPVEVVPEDYDELKRRAADAESREDELLYTLGGLVLPSVTQIMSPMSSMLYAAVPQAALDAAADRGTRAHEQVSNYVRYGVLETDEDTAPYVRAFLRFCKDYLPTWQGSEIRTYHRQMMYAGTLDLLGHIEPDDGQGVDVVDLKCTAAYHSVMLATQIGAYAHAMQSHGMKIRRLYGLQLMRDGRYHFGQVDDGYKNFLHCMAIYNAMQAEIR